MNRRNHALARALIQGALDRYTAVPREDHEGDAQLIVLGAILEEFGARRSEGFFDKAKATAWPLAAILTATALLWMVLEKI